MITRKHYVQKANDEEDDMYRTLWVLRWIRKQMKGPNFVCVCCGGIFIEI